MLGIRDPTFEFPGWLHANQCHPDRNHAFIADQVDLECGSFCVVPTDEESFHSEIEIVDPAPVRIEHHHPRLVEMGESVQHVAQFPSL